MTNVFITRTLNDLPKLFVKACEQKTLTHRLFDVVILVHVIDIKYPMTID